MLRRVDTFLHYLNSQEVPLKARKAQISKIQIIVLNNSQRLSILTGTTVTMLVKYKIQDTKDSHLAISQERRDLEQLGALAGTWLHLAPLRAPECT